VPTPDGYLTEDEAIALGDSRAGMGFYRTTRVFLRLFLLRPYRVEVEGRDRLDLAGPVVVAPVHRSNFDAPILGAISIRRMRYLAKRSLFKGRALSWVMSALGGFPVDRENADRGALASAQRLLEQGDAVLVFPEGTRQSGDVVPELFEGAVFLASRTNAPIVPVGIHGSEGALPPGKRLPRLTRIRVVVGEPIHLEAEGGRMRRSARQQATADLRVELQRLYDAARRPASRS